MKCSKCGSELQEGHLYCEQCGFEIQIVPNFEPEIENSINETLNTLAEDFEGETSDIQDDLKTINRAKKRTFHIGIGGAVLLCLVVIIAFFISNYRNGSYDYQIKKALNCANKQDYVQAIAFLNRAISINDADEEARLLMADYYIANSEEKNAKIVLREIIAINSESEAAYGKLIEIYKQNKDYEAISRLLLGSTSQLILEKFNKYVAMVPKFSSPEGNYNEVVPLKLSSNTAGEIYYTINGKKPDENSIRYTAPFMLETGEYHIQAIFINEYGVASEIIEKVYKIDVAIPLAPEVALLSGSYSAPTMIEVKVPDLCNVYYTIDGTTPTQNSILYTVPIAMPMGSSYFKFIAYSEDDVAGEVTTRNFSLKVNTVITPPDAVNLLVQGLKERGTILELDGSIAGKTGHNSYIASTLINIGGNYIYLVVEYYKDAIGTLTKTGALYGVDANTGVLYKVTTDNKGNYLANPI